mgnify:CR=1 FL=1
MKYSVEIGFNGIITQSLEGVGFPNQIISISTEYPGTKIGCGLSNNIKQIVKDFNAQHSGSIGNQNIYKILRKTINEWLLKRRKEQIKRWRRKNGNFRCIGNNVYCPENTWVNTVVMVMGT